MLSCSCNFDDYEYWYQFQKDFKPLDTPKRKRCCSCNKLIPKGEQTIKFNRWREARTDIEERIHGSEVQLAPWYMCEWCGEMFLNLEALGYCHNLGESIKENLKDYWNITGFEPISKTKSVHG